MAHAGSGAGHGGDDGEGGDLSGVSGFGVDTTSGFGGFGGQSGISYSVGAGEWGFDGTDAGHQGTGGIPGQASSTGFGGYGSDGYGMDSNGNFGFTGHPGHGTDPDTAAAREMIGPDHMDTELAGRFARYGFTIGGLFGGIPGAMMGAGYGAMAGLAAENRAGMDGFDGQDGMAGQGLDGSNSFQMDDDLGLFDYGTQEVADEARDADPDSAAPETAATQEPETGENAQAAADLEKERRRARVSHMDMRIVDPIGIYDQAEIHRPGLH